MNKIFTSTLLISTLILFSACSSKSQFMKQDALQAHGEYKKASENALSHIDTDDKMARDNLLWELYLGQSLFFDNNDSESIKRFSQAEDMMKYHRERVLGVSGAKEVGAILSNDNTLPYIGNEYDGIMANTYKAMSYLKTSDYSGARVEFNRAIDRQRRAKVYFSEAIQKENEAALKEQTSNQSQNAQDTQMSQSVNKVYPELNSYKVYPDFVNPMTNYIAALFALANDDKAKAEYLLKETSSMLPHNSIVIDDYKSLVEGDTEDTVWVIYEEGLAPVLNEFRMDFPAWIFSSQVDIVSIALPKMQTRSNAFSQLDIADINGTIASTQLLSSMDRVMQTEFKQHYPSIMRRAIFSAISKAAIQATAHNSGGKNGDLIAFAAAIYTIASTQADTRLWTSLPKNFHIAKFKKNGRESIDIYAHTKGNVRYKISTLKLIPAQHTLIYVKIPSIAHKANISIFSLGE